MTVAPAQLASVLQRRQRERLERAEEQAAAARQSVLSAVRELQLADDAWLIGSLAWGGFDESSDVDLVLKGIGTKDLTRLWHRLETELGRPVDLLRLEDLPDDFRRRVLSEGLRLDVT